MCKRFICLVSIVLALGLTTTVANANLADGLVGYWPLDEGAGATTADASGNGNDGTINGGPNWVEGKLGGALDFDGSDDYVDCGNPPILDPGTSDFTINAWVKTTDPGGDNLVFSKGGDSGGGIRYELMFRDNSGGDVRILVDDNNDKYDPDTDDKALSDGQWHHLVAMRRNGTELRVYVDGVEDMGVTNHGESTIPAGYDLSGTSQHNAYIGANYHNQNNVVQKFFRGVIDDVAVWNRALTVDEIAYLWNGGAGNSVNVTPAGQASDPYPEDEQTDVPRNVALNWSPGEFASASNGHTVYLSEIFDDVNDGIGGIAQSADSYVPDQRLEFGTTYYWRVDEVNGAPDFTVHPGEVWSFTTEPVGYPIANVTATASSSIPNQGPENTVNGSGLSDDLHSTETITMWLSAMGGPQPSWIQFEFDKVCMLHEMWVWNSNTDLEASIGFGFKDVAIEHSLDGIDYTALGTTHEFARAPGADNYAHNTTVDFGGLQARYVRLTVDGSWGGFLPQFGLSEVRFFHIPVRAREPHPDSGATDVDVDVTLGWRAGRQASEHNVYVSADKQAVIDGAAAVSVVTETSHGPLSLDLGSAYYWRVDEVNDVETPATWQGDISSFSTQEYLVVDGFESYNDIPAGEPGSNLVYVAWVDGFDNPSANGSTMGYVTGESLETGIVHGDDKSVPFAYDNATAGISEVVRSFAPARDWTAHGVITLSLWFAGDAANVAGQLYVKVNGVQVNYDGDSSNLTRSVWQAWNIDLTAIGTNLSNVASMAIGIQGSGATGALLLDDIRLYSQASEFVTPVQPGDAGLLLHLALDEGFGNTAGDSSGNGRDGALFGATWRAGGYNGLGSCLEFGGDGDHVLNADATYLNGLDAMTISVWVKSDVTDADKGFLVFQDPAGNDNNGMRYDSAGATGGGTNVIKMSVVSTGDNQQIESSENLQTTEWQHCVVVWNSGEQLKFYINGMPDSPSANSGATTGVTTDFEKLILGKGGKDEGPGDGWDGLIDDLRIYDHALSDAEIAGLSGMTKPYDKPL